MQGKGFPVDAIPAASFPTVLLFATGSGISPIKAVIESGVLDVAKRSDVRLYYGTRSEGAPACSMPCACMWRLEGTCASWEAAQGTHCSA